VSPRMKELSSRKFGKLTVIKASVRRGNGGNLFWDCICDCGKPATARADSLENGKTISCGCTRKNSVPDEAMVGKKFEQLLVLRKAPDASPPRWECLCDCGNIVSVPTNNLRSGNTKSCGCGQPRTKHGGSGTAEFKAWASAKGRCFNPQNSAYRYYGGRGITVCDRWASSFQDFLKDVGLKPAPEYSLDRINPDGNYEPGNVRWATPTEQIENRKVRGLTFNTYQHETRKTAIYPKETDLDAATYCCLGLAGEAGEVAGKLKKVMRDGGCDLTAAARKSIAEELGDVLWYASELASSLGVSLDSVAQANLRKLESRKKRGVLGGSGDKR
jgi:NTP pyrophosphatase (non-canonical NTP hydrolase)